MHSLFRGEKRGNSTFLVIVNKASVEMGRWEDAGMKAFLGIQDGAGVMKSHLAVSLLTDKRALSASPHSDVERK